ncbi:MULTISPECIES: glycosyltransferase family 39 protein, partial [Streptomyces]
MRRFPVRRPGGDVLCLLAVTAVAVALRAWNATGTPFPNDDEGTYLAQAWAVRQGRGLAHYTYWYDHPPLGWAQLAALSWVPELLLPDAPSFARGRYAMLPVAAACAALLHLVARRLGLPPAAAVTASLLHALSPLAVSLGRQVFLDNFAVVWALAAFALALSPRRALWHHVAAGAAFAAAVLSKETIALLLPALLVALWQGSHRRTRLFSLTGFVSGTLLCAGYPLYAVLKGELLPGPDHVSLLGSVFFQLGGRAGTGSVLTEGSEARRLVGEWLALDPVLPLAGLAAAVAALAVRRLRPAAVAAVLLTAVGLRPEGYLPRMYVLQVLPFLALALAGVGWRAARAVARRS